ncbi:hypothetical protein [Microbulbifer magnicolonia]|uniref:hypothetical protein n=1 Tax=Microbulbifer magnicolonia TaxID=3109744 RepID=UPI002B412476|nr:hypothetical protein [Microbulbifer sp. GG15]
MIQWITLLGAVALSVSLLLVMRVRAGTPQRIGAALTQVLIWATAWMLLQPPALLPPRQGATLDSGGAIKLEPELALAEIANLQTLKVRGDGLRRDALRDLPPVRLENAEPSPAAAWRADWPRELMLGEPLRLQISGGKATDSSTSFTLEDPYGAAVDSATIAAGENIEAALRALPKLGGPQLYQLRIETDANDRTEVRREPVPIVVHGTEQPAVLLWLAQPSFETAALSRWLRQSGVPAQVITQLAPSVVRRETFNGLEDKTGQPLNASGPFDLLVLDSRLWPQLTAAQRRALATHATQKSLLWLVGDDSPREFLDYARAQQMPLQAAEILTSASPLSTDDALPPLRLRGYQPQHARAGDLQLNGDSGTLYWGRSNGEGALGFVLFADSHRWPTAGFAMEYARLWKSVFDRQLARRGSRAAVSLSTELPLAGRRLTLCSDAFAGGAPRLARADTEAGLAATALAGMAAAKSDSGSCYAYWPEHAGWYQGGDEANPFSLYVFATDAWPEWHRALSRAQTRQMATARLGPATQAQAPQRPLPLQWPALALLLLLSFTWWRERRSLR